MNPKRIACQFRKQNCHRTPIILVYPKSHRRALFPLPNYACQCRVIHVASPQVVAVLEAPAGLLRLSIVLGLRPRAAGTNFGRPAFPFLFLCPPSPRSGFGGVPPGYPSPLLLTGGALVRQCTARLMLRSTSDIRAQLAGNVWRLCGRIYAGACRRLAAVSAGLRQLQALLTSCRVAVLQPLWPLVLIICERKKYLFSRGLANRQNLLLFLPFGQLSAALRRIDG